MSGKVMSFHLKLDFERCSVSAHMIVVLLSFVCCLHESEGCVSTPTPIAGSVIIMQRIHAWNSYLAMAVLSWLVIDFDMILKIYLRAEEHLFDSACMISDDENGYFGSKQGSQQGFQQDVNLYFACSHEWMCSMDGTWDISHSHSVLFHLSTTKYHKWG